jgi:tRNA G18 (ribose-2'-O)-methylase SpoU
MNQMNVSRQSTISQKRPDMHLVITNISKRNNIRSLLQSAASFGCASVLVVGQKMFDFSVDGKDMPDSVVSLVTSGRMAIQTFSKWEDCVNYLHQKLIRLVGVEIHEDAQLIEKFFDYQDTAFLMGNEGQGILEKHMKSCDAFVRIPQYGQGTASLNVYVAASIVLHRYHHWQRTATFSPGE